ncbi:MAG: DNA repair exonuclease [Nitrospirota bacterium]|nr:DNA repair exonuclease [Nitrospirota bacterium]
MSDFRFLHAADIHLDSPLRGLSGQEGEGAMRIRGATREALENLVSLAIDEEVSFVIIAGDLYDGDWKDYRTGLFFVKQMGRLSETGISVFLLYGNHDAESQITRRLLLPSNVRTFSSKKPETFTLPEIGVVLHGQSFRQRDVTDNLATNYPPPVPGNFNIGVLHTGLGGMGGHVNYAPCTLDELIKKGYDYWALGHVHQTTVLHEWPHVVFPGNIQGRHIRETGPKGVCLVTVKDGEIREMTTIPVDVVRWARLSVDAEGCHRMTEVVDRIGAALEEAVTTRADGRLLACRIEIAGRTGVHGQLLSSEESLVSNTRAAALGLGSDRAWIEKVEVSTRPLVDETLLHGREDALGEFSHLLEQAKDDKDLLDQLEGDIGGLVRKLPHEIRTDAEDPTLESAIKGDYGTMIDQVKSFLMARLSPAQGE